MSRCPSSHRCSTARRTPRRLSVTTLATPLTPRFITSVGFCLAMDRIAASDMRELLSTIPSTMSMARSMASRSMIPDSREWASSMV